MYSYAQLDENNICTAVSQVPKKWCKDNIIELESFDTSLLGKKYNNRVWEDVEIVNEPVEIQDSEVVRAQILLNQQEIKITQQSQDAVLAEILLAQQTV